MNKVILVGGALALAAGCKQDTGLTDLAGGDGELRFNLEFTNEANVDLDLHVLTPAGFEIYYDDKSDGQGGQLDLDCYCDHCDDGPYENVFWEYGSSPPSGTYTVAVDYFIFCEFSDTARSDYTLRVLVDGTIVETHTGSLGFYDPTPSFTFTY